jgi:1-deoxy-D-xylulose-5-phosphate synthase
MRPVVAVYSSFLQRAYDQILHDVCLQHLPVLFIIDRAGIVGPDGETHQGVYDFSFLSHMPNMTILAPKNRYELTAMLSFAMTLDGPAAIRFPRGEASKVLSEYNAPILYGRAETIAHGKTIALASIGAMMDTANAAAEKLRQGGYMPGLYNARFVKPLDMDLAARLTAYDYVFTLEDNARLGGYGMRMLTAMASLHKPMPYFHSFAFPDVFPEQGTRTEIFKRYQLDADSVSAHILRVCAEGKQTR